MVIENIQVIVTGLRKIDDDVCEATLLLQPSFPLGRTLVCQYTNDYGLLEAFVEGRVIGVSVTENLWIDGVTV